MHDHLVIVGGGQAAAQAALSLRSAGYDRGIKLIGEEASLPYQRPPLSKRFLAGEMEASRLLLKSEEYYRSNDIELIVGRRVERVDAAAKRISLSDSEQLEYGALLLATGSSPRRLRLPGIELPGVHYLRTISDVEAIRQEFLPGKSLLIVGAGYIGLEVAAVAAAAGLAVTIVEMAERVMARSVCSLVSDFYADRHRWAGVRLQLGTGLTRLHGDSRVRAAETSGGERLDCDLVIVGIGIEPNTELAAAAGLVVANGIEVDAGCRTTAPGIYAAGDCTSYPHPWVGRRVRLESVQSAIEQGKAAAAAICGQDEAFAAVPWFWSDQYELKLQIAGLAGGFDETVVRGSPDDGSFAVFYLAAGRVIAVDAVNDPRNFVLARNRLSDRPQWPAKAIADPATDLAAL